MRVCMQVETFSCLVGVCSTYACTQTYVCAWMYVCIDMHGCIGHIIACGYVHVQKKNIHSCKPEPFLVCVYIYTQYIDICTHIHTRIYVKHLNLFFSMCILGKPAAASIIRKGKHVAHTAAPANSESVYCNQCMCMCVYVCACICKRCPYRHCSKQWEHILQPMCMCVYVCACMYMYMWHSHKHKSREYKTVCTNVGVWMYVCK
jgi:hypothetical protein